jgi:cyclophilin family peptidyl-prolyl cis-trans isomerase
LSISVAAGVPPAVKPGILPGGICPQQIPTLLSVESINTANPGGETSGRTPDATTRACRHRRLAVSFFLSYLICFSLGAQTDSIGPVPQALREQLKLDPFYRKYLAVGKLPILSSTNACDFALFEAAYIVRHMLSLRPDIIDVLATNRVKIVVMAYNEYTTDLPEQRHMEPPVYWDSRARGLGGRTCSGAEENLLCYPGDPYSTENIFIHEFGHVIHGIAMKALDPTFDERLRAAYESATNHALWKGTYAGTSPGEYWAESVQDWFDNNRFNDALHNHVHTRAMLKGYDPGVARLCAEVFGEVPWRYLKPMERAPADRSHLAGFDSAQAPRFRWRDVPIPDAPRVRIETELGNIELELAAKAAPITVKNFLRYAHERLYNDGLFFRTVTPSNQPSDKVKIQVLQAEASPARTNEFYPPIRLERTRDTGLQHLDGTLSMARDGPDTAQDSFFICIGDQPELDFGGNRNPDGQGFAAFGKVVSGMDLVRRIHDGTAAGQQLTPPVRIQRAIRLN